MGTTLRVTGMSCEGCEEVVETALEMAGDVESADADHSANEATIEGDPSVDELVEKVSLAGYTAEAP
jgi:copper chaperone